MPSRPAREPWLKPAATAMITLAGLAGLTSCQSGPDGITDGSYQLLASSAGAEPDAAQTVEIAGSTVTLHTASGDATATLGSPASTMVLCPPHGDGKPTTLGDSALTMGRVTLTHPAVFGDCGSATPERITLVDLDGVDTAQSFPFTRWAEFCLSGSQDC